MVTVCPTNLEDWEKAEKQFSCNSSDIYHCLLDEFGRAREVCTLPSWIESGLCSIFNTNASKIDTIPCDKANGKCPDVVYWSTHIFRYSACNTQDEDEDQAARINEIWIIVGIAVLVLIAMVVAVLLLIRRRRQRKRELTLEERPLLSGDEIPPLLKDHLNDKLYIETRAFDEAKRLLDENKFVILVGSPGSGTTEHGLELLHRCGTSRTKMGRKVLNSFSGWKKALSSNSRTCILFDACLGRWNRPSEPSDTYRSFFDEILHCCDKGKLYAIFTMRSIIWQQLKDLPDQVKNAVVDLSHENFVLNEDEKKRILESHFKHFNYHIIEDSKKKEEKENYKDDSILNTAIEVKIKRQTLDKLVKTQQSKQRILGFPEACSLFCRVRKYTMEGVRFFQNPYKSMENIGILHRSNNPSAKDSQRYDYAVFVYVMLKGGVIHSEQNENMFQNIIENLELEEADVKCIDRILQYYLDSIVKKSDAGSYRLLHSSVLEIVFRHFGERHPELLIQYCNDQLLIELIKTDKSPAATSDFEVTIKKKHYNLLAARFHAILREFPVVEAYQLPIFIDKKFREVYDVNDKQEKGKDDCVVMETGDLSKEPMKETGSKNVETNGSGIEIDTKNSREEDKNTKQTLLKDHLNDKLYIETRAFDEAKRLLDKNKFVILVGSPGSGKTEHGLELLHRCRTKMRRKVLSSISGWKNALSRILRTCILFDACLGRWNRPSEPSDTYRSFFDEILHYCDKGKLYAIFTIRSIIWQQLKDLPDQVKNAVVDLSHENFVLNEDEKTRILESHFKHFNYHIIEDSKMKEEKENYQDNAILNTAIEVKIKRQTLDKLVKTQENKQCILGFPEVCSLFCRVRKYTMEGVRFFQNPYKSMKDIGILHISNLRSARDSQRYDYAVFVYVMLKGGVIHSEKNEKMFQNVIENLEVEEADVKCMDIILQYYLDSIVKKSDAGSYRFLHSSVLEFVFRHIGEQHPELLIQYCNDQLLIELIKTENSPAATSDFEVTIKKKHYNLLAARFHEISREFPVGEAYQLPIFNDKKFREVYDKQEEEKDDYVVIEAGYLPEEPIKETGRKKVETTGSGIEIDITTSREEDKNTKESNTVDVQQLV